MIYFAIVQEGSVLACDVSEEFTNRAKKYWQEAGVSDKVHIANFKRGDEQSSG